MGMAIKLLLGAVWAGLAYCVWQATAKMRALRKARRQGDLLHKVMTAMERRADVSGGPEF